MANEDNSPSLIAEGGAFIALSTLAIVLRFWSRSLLPANKFQADDWTALAAYPFVVSALALLITWAENGLGQHAPALSHEALQLTLAKKLIWNTGVTLSRISVLLFYRRLFDNAAAFKKSFWWGVGFNIAWWTMLFFFVMFGCNPVPRQWDHTIMGTCMQELPGQILSSLTSFILDVYILIIPFPLLLRLQMAWTRKIIVAFIFLIGYSVPLLSLGRLIVTVKNKEAINDDPDWGYGLQEFWSMCEIAIAFIGVTIPGAWTLLRRAIQFGPQALFNDHDYASAERSENRLSTASKLEAAVIDPEKSITLQGSPLSHEESWKTLHPSYWSPEMSKSPKSPSNNYFGPLEVPSAVHREYPNYHRPRLVAQKGYWSPDEPQFRSPRDSRVSTPEWRPTTRGLIARSMRSAYDL